MKRLLLILALAGLAYGQTTIPSATPPNPIDSTDLTANQIALINTATSGGTCHAGTHIWCAHNTSGTNNGNGANFVAAFGHHGDTAGHSATGNIESGTSLDGEIIVVDANDGAANHQYSSATTGGAPFVVQAGNCWGNNTNGFNDGPCRFYLGPLVQPDTSNIKPIIVVTSHYANFPAEHHRAIPITGDGLYSPKGQVANVSPTDYATFQTFNSDALMMLSQNDTNGVRFIGIEFTTTAANAGAPANLYQRGFSYGLVKAFGAGITGSRNLYIKDGTAPTYLAAAIRISGTAASVPGPHVLDYPTISETHVVAGTPCTQTWNLQVPLDTATLVCFVGIGTHWAAGRSELTMHFNAKNWPASDATVNVLASGGGSGQCAAGATNAGNGVLGNLCVVDATHAYASVTISTVTPANGGIHPFVIDTAPVGGDTYTAGTEHSITDAVLKGAYPAIWSVSCSNCPVPITNGTIFLPTNNVPYIFTATGTSTGPNATSWDANYLLRFTYGGRCTALNTPLPGCIATTNTSVVGGVQSITEGWYNTSGALNGQGSSGGPSYQMSAYVNSGSAGFGFNDIVTSGSAWDWAYKIGQLYYAPSLNEAIDHCGPSRFQTNYIQRGSTTSLTCTGVGTNWSAAQLNCSGNCNTANLNFGSNVTINSVSVASPTQLTINLTVQGNAETGARHIVFDRSWAHGSDGQIYDESSTSVNLIPCTTAAGSTPINNHCYVVNSQDVNTGFLIEGPHDAVIDSYVNAIHNGTTDSQAIGMTVGLGPIRIRNNFASSSTENIFTGGGTGTIYNSGLIAAEDVEIDHNYIYKPPIYDNYGVGVSPGNCSAQHTTATGNHFGCVWSIKNLWETKGCNRCWIHENVMENNWVGAVVIYTSNVMTPRNAHSQGTPASSVDDILHENNLIVGVHNAFSITNLDVNSGYGPNGDNTVDAGAEDSVEARRIVIQNDLIIPNQNGSSIGASNFKNSSLQFSFPWDTLVQHNTWLPETGVILNNANFSFGGPYLSQTNNASGCGGNIATSGRNIWELNNVIPMGWGANNGCLPAAFLATPSTSGSTYNDRIHGNVMPKPGNGVTDASNYYATIPSGGVPTVPAPQPNTFPQLDQSQPFSIDYTLNGPLPTLAAWIAPTTGTTTDGLTAGVNMAPIQAMALSAMKGTPSGVSNPNIQTVSLPVGAVGEVFSGTLTATGGTAPYTWSITTGAMTVCPTTTAGLCLNASDSGGGTTISGTPDAGATSTFTVEVTDSLSGTDTQPLTLVVNPALTVATTAIPTGTVGRAYSTSLASTGGIGPFTWSITSGSMTACPTLTQGLCMNSSGGISGTITGSPGTLTFTVQVADPGGAAAQQPLDLVIVNSPTITTVGLSDATLNVPYSQTLTGVGGTLPYTWSISVGTLPTGLSLNASTGAITGTPTVGGTSNFTVTLTDGATNTATAPLSINVNTNLQETNTTFPVGLVGIPYSQPLTASGGTPPYSFTVIGGALPGGLTVTGATISGIPQTAATYNFAIQVTDSASQSANSIPLSIVIFNPGKIVASGAVLLKNVVIKP